MARHFRDLFCFRDRVRYIAWHLAGRRTPFHGSLRSGVQLSMRGLPSDDFKVAYEVFCMEVYRTGLAPSEVHRIVDLGGNVGYSCLYFCRTYPNADVLAFEPHPVHCDLLELNVKMNGYSDRVKLVRAAAATHSGRVNLTDNGGGSTVIGPAGESHGLLIQSVDAVDVFSMIGQDSIDILKMDIEGSEYELMEDPRFEALSKLTHCIVMEWHNYRDQSTHLGHDWIVSRLSSLDFQIEWEISSGAWLGMLSATRKDFRPVA